MNASEIWNPDAQKKLCAIDVEADMKQLIVYYLTSALCNLAQISNRNQWYSPLLCFRGS